MRLDFAKLTGLGNDFVMIYNLDGAVSLDAEQVKHLCDRHFGIGADGVILVDPPRDAETNAFMNYINSDGTLAQMCGNGVRCFAKFLVDRGIVDVPSKTLVAGTLAGPKRITYETEDDKMTVAKVNMGKPVLEPCEIPTTLSANAESSNGVPYAGNALIDSPWGSFSFTTVSMGNPHAVCFIEDFDDLPAEIFSSPEKNLSTLDLGLIGPFFESCSAFPEKANIEFAEVGDEGIDMRVFERGCGETLACGTGACATNVAASLTGRAPRKNTIHLLGGDLLIDWADDGDVFMTGPATQVFCGSIEI